MNLNTIDQLATLFLTIGLLLWLCYWQINSKIKTHLEKNHHSIFMSFNFPIHQLSDSFKMKGSHDKEWAEIHAQNKLSKFIKSTQRLNLNDQTLNKLCSTRAFLYNMMKYFIAFLAVTVMVNFYVSSS